MTRAVSVSGLRVLDVSKSFPSSRGPRPVLKNISFQVPPGGLVCLLGPNGSGKTTLLKTIGTLLLPDGGRVLLDEVDVHRASVRAKEKIGFASTEDQSFYGRLSARMNLWFYGQMHGMPNALFERRLRELSSLLDLSGSLDRPFRELSSGQKQRYLLARADLHDPTLLILDEPHQNLDPRFASRLREVIRDEWCGKRKKTVLISTHHLDDARKISDQWVVLGDGRVRFEGSVAAALEKTPAFDLETFFHRLTDGPGASPSDARAVL